MTSLAGPWVHAVDPVIVSIAGVHLWWYGASYTLGFLVAHAWLRLGRVALGLSLRAVYDLSLLLAGGVLVGGRLVEVAVYEWPFYRAHVQLIPAVWLGGMATHGLLVGGLAGVWTFCRLRRAPLLRVTDALAVPAAVILGVGRLGNFIDGQIVGSPTDVWWAVKFPDADGFRHPVVLYDGLKNLLLVPCLALAGRRSARPGFVTGLFLVLYAGLRVVVDQFREYPTALLGLATGQVLNLVMALGGLGLVAVAWPRPGQASVESVSELCGRRPPRVAWDGRGRSGQLARPPGAPTGWRPIAFAGLACAALVIPSDWTQDVPARYGARHPGLRHSVLYPRIVMSPAPARPADTPRRDDLPAPR